MEEIIKKMKVQVTTLGESLIFGKGLMPRIHKKTCVSAQPCPTLRSMVVQQQVVILEFSQEKMSAHPSTLNSMKQYEKAQRYDTER